MARNYARSPPVDRSPAHCREHIVDRFGLSRSADHIKGEIAHVATLNDSAIAVLEYIAPNSPSGKLPIRFLNDTTLN